MWQKNWFADEKQSDLLDEALWGVQGRTHLHRIIRLIIDESQGLVEATNELTEKSNEESKPLSRLKRVYKGRRTKQEHHAKIQQITERSAILTRAVDELWIYSETVFDSLHGILLQDPIAPERDKLLNTALRSTACSLELYSHCSVSTLRCCLKMDLLNQHNANGAALYPESGASPSVFYQLLTKSRLQDSFQKMTIETVESPENLTPNEDNGVIQSIKDLQLIEPSSNQSNIIVKVASRGSTLGLYLRIPRQIIQGTKLSQDPENLGKVLERQQDTNLSIGEHLSRTSKVELAYKVVESGFFLLGTPWFASLSSHSLWRLKNSNGLGESWYLETQIDDLENLPFYDSDALAESSQLFRLEILLMEIALDQSDLHSRSDESGQEASRISKLPVVEQRMGLQYCKAMAFCLHYRQCGKPYKSSKARSSGRFTNGGILSREVEKYDDANFDGWQEYLAELLQQYYSQVYLRIQGLRDIDDKC